MSVAYVSNIVINSGADFSHYFTLDINLTGYSVFSQMRKHSSSPTAVSFASTFTASDQSVVGIGLSASQSEMIKPGRYVYDVLIENPEGIRTRVIEGMALVTEGVTKID